MRSLIENYAGVKLSIIGMEGEVIDLGLFKRDKKGYKRFADSGTLVHRHVAERKLGRKLRRGEVVHHRDGNKLNNHRRNLQVFRSQRAHHAHHKRRKKKTGSWFG